jgi:hypothetical protein
LACPLCRTPNPEHALYCTACRRPLENHYRHARVTFTHDYDNALINGVFLMRRTDSCPACQSLQGKTFLPWKLPRIPVVGCTHPDGCRCSYMPQMRISLGFPGFGARARRKDWEERQQQARLRRARGEDA